MPNKLTIDELDVSNDLSVSGNTSITGNLNFGLIKSGFATNIGMTLASGVLTITQADGAALSTGADAGRIVLPSTTSGQLASLEVTSSSNLFEDASGTSDITGQEWGATTGVAWGNDRPFFIYACNASVGVRFFISPDPTKSVTPSTSAEHGYHGNPSSNNADTDIFWMSSADLTGETGRPCVRIGGIRMQMNTSDDWTIQALDESKGDGIRHDPFVGKVFTFPTGQMGAASGVYFENSGGTAPVFTKNEYFYELSLNGELEVIVGFEGDGGTDGSGAVNMKLAIPYVAVELTTASGKELHSGGFRLNTPTNQYACMARLVGGTSLAEFLVTSGAGTVDVPDYADFGNGTRGIIGKAKWLVFGSKV